MVRRSWCGLSDAVLLNACLFQLENSEGSLEARAMYLSLHCMARQQECLGLPIFYPFIYLFRHPGYLNQFECLE